jgi:mono/diheme cytochrome c family protein
MSAPSQQHDFEDSTPAAVSPPPVASEKTIPTDGDQPISIRATVICGAVLIFSGLVLGYSGNQLSYSSIFRDGYVRTPAPGSTATPPPPKPAMEAYMARGKKVFESKCITCHGPEAKGNGVSFPTLVGSPWALGETERFAMIVLNGLDGPISDGKKYGVMTPQGIGMKPEELAGVMTYIRNHFGNTKGDVVTVEMARNAMKISAARKNAGTATTGEELTANHLKALVGKEVTATTMVDPITLDPVPAAAAAPAAAPAPAAPGAPATGGATPAPAAPGDAPKAP